MIYRECAYFVNLRQAYLLSPRQAKRLSSRTVLFTSVPKNCLHEDFIRTLFGGSIKTIWIPQNTRVLRALVKEREQTATRLEKAEISLIKLANSARNRQLRSRPSPVKSPMNVQTDPVTTIDPTIGPQAGNSEEFVERRSLCKGAHGRANSPKESEPNCGTPVHQQEAEKVAAGCDCPAEYVHPYGFPESLPDVRGSVAAQWIPASSRPTHRPLANFGRSIDTIRWTRLRLKDLNAQIAKFRRLHRRGQGQPLNAVFVEFENQAVAQTAFQILPHHLPLHMSPCCIGVRPQDIIWSNLRLAWWERIARRFFVLTFIAAAVLFWSIPSAFVGLVSNIDFLATKVQFLMWLRDMPAAVKGVIQGLLPALALSMLMAVVPFMLRGESHRSDSLNFAELH